jgi:glycosidase
MAQQSGTASALARLVLAVAATGCSAAPEGRCPLTVWYRPARLDAALAGVAPELVGSWDGWSRPGVRSFATVTSDDGTVWSGATINLSPGTYEYAISFGSEHIKDELNPRSAFVAGDAGRFAAEVSEVVLADCNAPTLTIVSAADDHGTLRVAADFVPGSDGARIAASSLDATLSGAGAPVATRITLSHSDDKSGVTHMSASAPALPPGKYTLALRARDEHGRALATQGSVFVATATAPATLSDELVYQVMVDRFRGPSGALPPPASPGDRAGGTLGGVRAALEAGYFEALGVTTLWLSPTYANTPGYERGRDGHAVTPYHGYWPEAPRTVDARLGGAAELDALVAAAHARGLRVILDVVPNHVYKDHPYFTQHSRTSPSISAIATAKTPLDAVSWFNDGPDACVCGDAGCDWGTHMETCWFAPYLPDLNWRHPAVMQAGSDDLAWWMQRFDLDGLRIDAVPMMPRAAQRRMLATVHDMMYRAPADLLVVGEVYTGPGDPGRAQIRAYLGDALDGLDSAFDFPLMWALRDALAHGSDGGFMTLEAELVAGESAWGGSGATMARIIGNHDTTRFISEIVGDAGGDPWANPPGQPSDAAPYQRQLIALAFIMTAPGIPVIYYGDELGLAGGGDPDSRRVMPDWATLPTSAAQLGDAVGKIGRARRCSPALRGARAVILADADHEVTLHQAKSDRALVVFSRDVAATTLTLSGVPAGTWQDVLSGARFTSTGATTMINVPSLSAAVYLPVESACLR